MYNWQDKMFVFSMWVAFLASEGKRVIIKLAHLFWDEDNTHPWDMLRS